MKPESDQTLAAQTANYERASSLIRWSVIAIIVVTYPPGRQGTFLAYAILAAIALYNLSRRSSRLMRRPLWHSAIATLVIDTFLISAFIYASGTPSTPYGLFYVLIIIEAAYQAGFKGALLVIALQSLALALINALIGNPLVLDPLRTIVASVAGLASIGFLLDSLTHNERSSRKALIKLDTIVKTEKERLLVLINSLTEAAFLIDRTGQILSYNASSLGLIDTHDNLYGKNLPQLLNLRDSRHRPVDLLVLAKNQPKVSRRDLIAHITPKIELLIELNLAAVHIGSARDSDNNFVVICRDITKEKSLDQEQEDFIAVTSHELRTPIAIAEAALSTALLPQMKLPTQVEPMVKQAYRNIIFLGQLVQDLTLLSEAQNNSIPIELKEIDAELTIAQLLKDYLPDAQKKGLKLTADIAPNTPRVLTTGHYVREILQNYIVNALKYSTKGNITISAAPTKEGGIVFGVKDSGIGISTSDQKHLFTKFYRSEDYRTRETGGTGLGLYLCAQLANRLSAKVWCDSVINVGSTFYLEVPPRSQLKRDQNEIVKAQVSTIIETL